MYQMKHLDGLLKLVDKEFEEMEQRGKFQNPSEAHVAYEMIDIVKDVHEIWECMDKMDNNYSEYGYGRYMYPYDDGVSYARGTNARRNAIGQYSRERGNSMMGGDYDSRASYRGLGGSSYSRGDAKSDYIARLYEMADNAPDERSREHLQKMIREMEQQ